MKKSPKIKIRQLKFHLDQLKSIFDRATSKEIISQVYLLRDKCEKAYNVANSLEKILEKNAFFHSDSKNSPMICREFVESLKNYFQSNNIKIQMEVTPHLEYYHLNLCSNIGHLFTPIYQFYAKNISPLSPFILRVLVVDGLLLLAFSIDGQLQRFDSEELQKIENFCDQNKGKMRLEKNNIHLRVFLPIYENCPIVERWAA